MSNPLGASTRTSPEPQQSDVTVRPKSPIRTATKRKRNDSDNTDLKAVPAAPGKRKGSKNSKVSKSHEDGNLDVEQGLNLVFGNIGNGLLADYVAKRTKRFFPELSLVEFEDRRIPETAFHDTTSWTKPRTLQALPSFLEHYSPKAGKSIALSSASEQPGSPHTLVITSAGLRAADITRALRVFQTKDAVVAKLFAKHIKLREAIEYVKKTRMSIGVGTPSRIIDLFDSSALSLSSLEQVVIDCSHIDRKKRGIFDMRETQQSLMALLNRPELKSRYGDSSGKVRLLFY